MGSLKGRLTLFACEDLEQEGHVLFILSLDGLGELLRDDAEELWVRVEVLGECCRGRVV